MTCFRKGEAMDSDVIRLDPEPSILIESLRDIGYSFNSALADIVDNSITAEATSIRVLAIPDPEFRIAIIDDGNGLSRDDLKQAMRLGSNDPRQKRALNDLGRFGLGLKTASFSQCRRLTVVSRKGSAVAAFTWDLDLVVAQNAWNVIERTDFSGVPFIGLRANAVRAKSITLGSSARHRITSRSFFIGTYRASVVSAGFPSK